MKNTNKYKPKISVGDMVTLFKIDDCNGSFSVIPTMFSYVGPKCLVVLVVGDFVKLSMNHRCSMWYVPVQYQSKM